MKRKDFFSVIIPTYNAKKYVEKCVSSILKNNYSSYEIVVVDNGSTDSTVEFLKKKFTTFSDKIKFVALDKNYGPAKARNEGVKIAQGKYLGFLDSDTEVEKNWIIEALNSFRKDKKVAALQCKLLLIKDKKSYDYAGEYLGNLGFLVPVAVYGEIDHGQYDSCGKVLAAKSAGMFIRKDVFDKIGGFDEDYFIFVEETDLGWRCWLAGYEVVFCPNSIVYHCFSSSKNIFDKKFDNHLVRFHGTKNYIMTLYKNLSKKHLLRILPIHVFLWACLSFYLLLTGKTASSWNIWKGIFWNLKNFAKNKQKRDEIQKTRRLTDKDIFVGLTLMKNAGLSHYIKRWFLSQKANIGPENQ